MAKILFGGPQTQVRGKSLDSSSDNFDLVNRLEERGNEVEYVTLGDAFLGHLTEVSVRRNIKSQTPYVGVIYDTRLFYDTATHERRVDSFSSSVIKWLKLPDLPVIVLADNQISGQIRRYSEEAGFIQIDRPYAVEDVVKKVESWEI